MKQKRGKPLRHKEGNTFAFKSFNARIGDVTVDMRQQLQLGSGWKPSGDECFLSEASAKWSDLNRTRHFGDFQREVRPKVQSHALVVHNIDNIAEALQRHLKVENSLALQPLLDYVVNFARDIQDDFYPYFEPFFRIFLDLLSRQDAEVIEWVFSTLAQLFRILKRPMVRHFEAVFSLMAELLDEDAKPYISRFATESFAFFIRSFKDPSGVIDFLLLHCKKHPNLAAGIGELMFEAVKNINHTLHSFFDKFYAVLLNRIRSETLSEISIRSCISTMTDHLGKYLLKETSLPFWTALLNAMSRRDQPFSPYYLLILSGMMDARHGGLVHEPDLVVDTLTDSLSGLDTDDEEISEAAVKSAALLMQFVHLNVDLQHRRRLARTVLTSKSTASSKLHFVEEVLDIPMFEVEVLPHLLDFCLQFYQTNIEAVMKCLTSLVLRKDPAQFRPSEIRKWIPLMLDFSLSNPDVPSTVIDAFLVAMLDSVEREDGCGSSKWSRLWSLLVILPHISPRVSEPIVQRVFEVSASAKRELSSASSGDESDPCQVLYVSAAASYVLTPLYDTFPATVSLDELIPLLGRFAKDVSFLCTVCCLLQTRSSSSTILKETNDAILRALKPNLRSSSHAVRKLSLQVLETCFPVEESRVNAAFHICLQAEQVEASIHEYREKLRFLRMLDAGQVQTSGILQEPTLNDVPLLYLFGCLKIGFQPVWKEIRTLIASYRAHLSKSLWPVLEAELKLVSDEAESSESVPVSKTAAYDGEPPNSSLAEMMGSHLEALTQTETNALSPFKYRIQLWQVVLSVSETVEARNRCFSDLFQRFMRNEFIPATLLGTSANAEDRSERKHDTSRKSRAEAEETCVTMLELFAAFRNPIAVFQEPVIRNFFLDLLTYRSPKVQSAALRCFFRYKFSYLQPYEAHLMKLLDDKDMWNTLTEIEFGAANPVIEEEHRPSVMPIILRILFGRMQMNSKARNTDKSTPKGRKNAIVRALANCRDHEFQYFLDLVLQPFEKGGNKEVHLKLADGILHTLFVIIDELRTGLGQSLHQVYQTVVGILSVVRQKIGTENIEDGSGSRNGAENSSGGLLKKLRKECYKCLTKFCSVFPASALSFEEKTTLFTTAVWPEIDTVVRDGPLTVTPLMRLFLSWSQSTTYHSYFSHVTDKSEQNILVYLARILDPNVASRSASIKLVIDVFNNLLHPQLEVMEDEKEDEVEEKTAALKAQGLSLLRPCVNAILQYFHDKIKRHLDAKKMRRGSPLSDPDLKLAVGVSDMILDADQSEALSNILLRLLACGEIKKDSEFLGLLEIEKRLVLSINPAKLSKSVQPLISMLSRSFTRDARMKICDILSIIADRRNTESSRELANLANDLLSWSARHVEEPDYERRGAAYQTAKARIIVQRGNVDDLDLPLLVLHIADYDIRQSTDIMSSSLRDFGLMCILTVVRCYGSTPGGVVILEHVMKLLKEALRNKTESVRNAYVAVLGEVVDFYPKHALFSELLFFRYPLSLKGSGTDKCSACNGVGLPVNGDVMTDQGQIQNGRARCKCYNQELDVFENLRHIQKHRVGAALHDIAVWTAAKAVPVSTVMQLFMPLATAHLCNDQYNSEKYQGLINAVIEIVGSVCAVVPWNKYEPMLKHFLAVLTRKPLFHKQIIRVAVAIVDNFHFDLSSVDITRTNFKSKDNPAMTVDVGELPDPEDANMEMEEAPPAEAAAAGSQAKPDATSKAKAEKVYRSLMHFILPGLSKLITDKVAGDESHKLTADLHVGEKEEILRAPVALAIVKLLQKLPEKIIRRQISGVFLKIGRLLKSRLLSIRQSARETLTEIMISLGPSYLPTLIKELRGVLQKGYQIHVLVHCVHMLLTKMLPQLKPGSLDRALSDLVQICHNEMFGELAEEKEVTALTRKIAEARNIKSYDTYAILARFVSPTVLLDLIKPLKEKAEEIQSHKIAVKLEKALRQILTGLMKNEQLTEKDLLLFCYALHDPSMGLFQAVKSKKVKEEKVLPEHLNRPDSYLIQAEPGRMGPMPVVNRKTNDYLLRNFGLQLLLSCFKSGRLAALSGEATEMLDPFVPLVIKCISSSHIPIRTSALRCLIWMLKFKLPSLESEMNTVVRQLFVHLKNYSGPGAAVAENAEFVTTVYKALSTTVREATFYQLSDKHLKVLLTYAENDFREGTKHILAANLLRAVLSRHLLTTELREIMLNIATVSIQSEQESLREECRQLVTVFLTTYHAKKIKAKEFVELYQDNLEYSIEYGRLISMAVLRDLLFKMGEGFQKEYALAFFQLFAARLSDESSTVRHNAAKYISLILHITDATLVAEIAKWIKRWLVDQEGAVRRTGLQVASLMVQVEKESFLPRLTFVLPSLEKILSINEIALTDEAIAEKDHLLINALNLLAKILESCGNDLWKEAIVVNKLKSVFASVQDFLLHEHEWVRIKSMDIFWNIFQLQPAAELPTNVIFAEDTVDKLRELTKRLLHMLKSYSEREDYYQVWSACMLYIVQASMALPQPAGSEAEDVEADEDVEVKEEENQPKTRDQKLTAQFIIRSICREAVYEALHEPRKTTKRLEVVKWIRRLTENFDKSCVTSFLPNIAHVLYRCTNEPSAQKNEELKRTTEEVSVAVESRVGREAYANAMRDVILVASKKRTARKRQQAIEPVLHPDKAARKRIKKQQTKKEARKRKLEDIDVGRIVKPKRAPRQ